MPAGLAGSRTFAFNEEACSRLVRSDVCGRVRSRIAEGNVPRDASRDLYQFTAHETLCGTGYANSRVWERGLKMRGPYGFEPSENCVNCGLRKAGFFCEINTAALKDFNAARMSATYPAGAVLFIEKQDPRGVFVLCAGEVNLSISSRAGKTLILTIAKPGEILGLMAAL